MNLSFRGIWVVPCYLDESTSRINISLLRLNRVLGHPHNYRALDSWHRLRGLNVDDSDVRDFGLAFRVLITLER